LRSRQDALHALEFPIGARGVRIHADALLGR
jgi:hypothetical protein